jgi:hypothetical protein
MPPFLATKSSLTEPCRALPSQWRRVFSLPVGVGRRGPPANSNTSLALVTKPQHSCPHRRPCRVLQAPRHARASRRTKRASPMKPLGPNLAIPSAVRFGFAIQLLLSSFSDLPGLYCRPQEAPGKRCTLRAFKATRHPHIGPIPCPQANRFRRTFQVLFCRGPMLGTHALLSP